MLNIVWTISNLNNEPVKLKVVEKPKTYKIIAKWGDYSGSRIAKELCFETLEECLESILDHYQKRIENYERQIKRLENEKDKIYASWSVLPK